MDGNKIASRIEFLIETSGVKKTHLGEVLGVKKDKSPQWKTARFNSFLNHLRKGRIVINDLTKIAEALNKPLSYFIGEKEYYFPKTKASVVKSPPSPPYALNEKSGKDLDEILKELPEEILGGRPLGSIDDEMKRALIRAFYK